MRRSMPALYIEACLHQTVSIILVQHSVQAGSDLQGGLQLIMGSLGQAENPIKLRREFNYMPIGRNNW